MYQSNLRMRRCRRPSLRWFLRLALFATWCLGAEPMSQPDNPSTAAQFSDRFVFLTGTGAEQGTLKEVCPEHFWPVPFVTDEVVHRLEIASPEKPFRLNGLLVELSVEGTRAAQAHIEDLFEISGKSPTSNHSDGQVCGAACRAWFPATFTVLTEHCGMRGDAAVEKASVQLARQLAGVTESRREALRDRCRAHFAHGGQGPWAARDAASLAADPCCYEVADDLLAFYIGPDSSTHGQNAMASGWW